MMKQKHMINKSSLIKAKPDLIIINTSRGAVVNEAHIIELIENKKNRRLWNRCNRK